MIRLGIRVVTRTKRKSPYGTEVDKSDAVRGFGADIDSYDSFFICEVTGAVGNSLRAVYLKA